MPPMALWLLAPRSRTGFDPRAIAGLLGWWDASDSSTLFDATSGGSPVAADGAVARWQDKSGGGRHATQGTSNNRPLRRIAQRNGLDVLQFDGTNDTLDVPAITIPSSHTVFSVFSRGSSGVSSIALGNNDATFAARRYSAWWFTDNVVYDRSNATAFTTHGGASTATGYFVVTTTRDATTSVSVRRNAAVLGTVTTGDSVTTPASGTWVKIGATRTGSAPGVDVCHNGNLCELLIYNTALADAPRDAVESYLSRKWGIA